VCDLTLEGLYHEHINVCHLAFEGLYHEHINFLFIFNIINANQIVYLLNWCLKFRISILVDRNEMLKYNFNRN
jgi:hypothetical protein